MIENTDVCNKVEDEKEQQEQKAGQERKLHDSGDLNKQTVSDQSVGFRNYLSIHFQFQPQISISEILERPFSKYNINYVSRRPRSKHASQSQFLDQDNENTYAFILGKMKTENCDKCTPKKPTGCEAVSRASIGFLNYYKVFLCHYPHYPKATAMRMARCLYKNLSEATKERYRCLGKFKCALKKRAARRRKRSSSRAKSPCRSKPKKCPAKPRKARAKREACQPKPKNNNIKRKAACPKPEPCYPQPNPCCPETKPKPSCPQPKTKPCCAQPKVKPLHILPLNNSLTDCWKN